MKVFISFLAVMLTVTSSWAGGMGCCPMAGGGGKMPIYLLILALGYWLLRMAEAETLPLLKKVGRAVSWVLLVGGALGVLSSLFSCHKKAPCPMTPTEPAAMAPAAPPAPVVAAPEAPAPAPAPRRKRSRR